jgi:glycosyltransferase involved in cell wall biosynthesis
MAATVKAFLTSIIVTTFNWPEALGAVLRSISGQTIQNLEIIVADDGSTHETAEIVQGVLGPCNRRWCHVWHPDNGIRQARVKNLAVSYSTGEYLIFVDHDVVLHPRFVEDHLRMACAGSFLQGKRVFLSDRQTYDLLQSPPVDNISLFSLGVGNRKNGLRIPLLGRLMAGSRRFQTSLRGCNLSMYRKDFMLADGYDETFDEEWGREDSDICYRLFHGGITVRNLWFQALQYHLAHKSIKRRGKDRLDAELNQVVREKRTRALKGFSQLSTEGNIVSAAGSFER